MGGWGRDERVDDVFFESVAGEPTEEGQLRRVSDDLRVFIGGEVKSVLTGSGISADAHKALRQLIHFIDGGPAEGFASGAYREVVGGIFPTSITWYESSSKLKKIVEKTITRSGGGATKTKPTPIAWVVYDTDGVTPLGTVSDAITYSGVQEVSRTRTITV